MSQHERFRRAHVHRFPVGDGKWLVYNRQDGVPHLLSVCLLAVLDRCGEPRTMAEHAERCRDLIASPQHTSTCSHLSPVEEHLRELIERHLLVAEAKPQEHFRQSLAPARRAPAINSVGVVTRDRPQSLRRCLVSYIENSLRYERANDFVVVDDAQSRQARDETRQMLRSLVESFGVSISYSGLEEKRLLAEKLCGEFDIPPKVVEFALFDPENCGTSIGANRNSLLLYTAGDLLFSVDDDTVCRVADVPGRRESLTFEQRWRDIDFWFYPDRESLLKAASFVERDLLAIHEELLGRELTACVSDFAVTSGLHLDGINLRTLADIQDGRGQIAATFTGLLGDTSMPTPIAYLLLEGESRRRLLASDESYRMACSSREVMRAVNRPSVDSSAWCATTAFGCDNRRLLPPFVPVARGEDDLWGMTLHACSPDSYFGYLPWAVLHAPLEERIFAPGAMLEAATSIYLNEIFSICLKALRPLSPTVGDDARLVEAGTQLMEMGAWRAAEWDEFIRLEVWRRESAYITFIEGQLERFGGQPAYWARDAREFIKLSRASMLRDDYTVPKELLARRPPEEARRLSQHLVRRFGELLYWWPQIVRAARSLRAGDYRLARPV